MEKDFFEIEKQKQLSKKDKSNIGEWDKKIISLCKKINEKKEYYTTSSCSGRIVLLKSSEEKLPNLFLWRTHEKTNFKELKKILGSIDFDGEVEFQQTPCILHVACKTIEDAFDIIKKAQNSGWKRSGIISKGKNRIIVELQSTENINFPIMKDKKILVDDKFLKLVIKKANKKLEKCWKKIKRFEKAL